MSQTRPWFVWLRTTAPALIDWMVDHGFEMADDVPQIVYQHEAYSVARTYWGKDKGKSLAKFFEPLVRGRAEHHPDAVDAHDRPGLRARWRRDRPAGADGTVARSTSPAAAQCWQREATPTTKPCSRG